MTLLGVVDPLDVAVSGGSKRGCILLVAAHWHQADTVWLLTYLTGMPPPPHSTLTVKDEPLIQSCRTKTVPPLYFPSSSLLLLTVLHLYIISNFLKWLSCWLLLITFPALLLTCSITHHILPLKCANQANMLWWWCLTGLPRPYWLCTRLSHCPSLLPISLIISPSLGRHCVYPCVCVTEQCGLPLAPVCLVNSSTSHWYF